MIQQKQISLSMDASPYCVGAVLSHAMEDGSKMPIAYASRTLNVVQKRYAQLDKEAAAIMFGFKKFHHYPSMGESCRLCMITNNNCFEKSVCHTWYT